MYARTTLGVATTLITALSLVPPLAAQEDDDEGMQEEITVTLAPKNDSGISGTAVLRHEVDAMGQPAPKVVIDLTGVEAGQSYSAHVHKGTCATGGGVVTALVAVEAQGSMASSTTVLGSDQIAALEAAHAEMMDMARTTDDEEDEAEETEEASGGLFIQIHMPDGRPAACGDVPMMEDHEDGGGSR